METGAKAGATPNTGAGAATMGGCTAAAAGAEGAAFGVENVAAEAEAGPVAAAGDMKAGAGAAAALEATNAAADGPGMDPAEAAEAAGRIDGASPAQQDHAWSIPRQIMFSHLNGPSIVNNGMQRCIFTKQSPAVKVLQ